MPDRSQVTDSFRRYLTLAPGQRSTVILRDVFGYTTAEVADLTGTSIAAVKAALHRGRKALQKSLATPGQPLKPLSEPEKQQLLLYARLFNDRNFDALRDRLTDEVHLELVSRTFMTGKKEVAGYFGNYDRVDDWPMMPGRVEGHPALLVFDPQDKDANPVYFILLCFENRNVQSIRDFRYARYVVTGAEWERFG